MTTNWQRTVLAGGFCVGAILLGASLRMYAASSPQSAAPAQAPASGAQAPPSANQTAAQRFKNIQVLKNIPADQLIPSMQFIAASLGVECEYCHVEHANDKDDKKPKLAARKMMTMMMEINAANFKGEREVTCYTCHRGATNPVGTPILLADDAAAPSAPRGGTEVDATSALPTSQALLDKWLAAVGGADALAKVKTRVQKGDIVAFDKKSPIEVYSEGPDKRVSVSHMGANDSVTGYNGTAGWLSTPNGVRMMNAAEQKAASIDAQLYFPAKLPQLYSDFKVLPGESINGKSTYLVLAKGDGLLPLRLYFDQESGMLVRLIRYAETPLGNMPTQIDYADFRGADGVNIPYRWTLARPNGRFTIEINDVKQNVPVDEKLFVTPTPPTRPASAAAAPNH